jgi:hypothetical protein
MNEPNPFPLSFMVFGGVAIAAGAWWIYRPAALIAAGLLLLAMGLYGRSAGGR